MAIDAYSICPCHQNQKIKFCCGKEIVSDLNQILDKYNQGRDLAALDDVERSIRKLGPKNCFLGLKVRILLNRDEIEKAAEANQLVLESDPGNFLGLCHQVMIDFHQGQIERGMERFQDVLEAVVGDQIPGSMLSLWKTVVIGLIIKGHLIAARSYLAMGNYLFQGEDPDLALIGSRMSEFPDENLLTKRWFQLLQVSSAVEPQPEWAKKYQAIQALVERGQFRRAYKLLKKLDAAFPEQPVLVYAVAVTALLTLQYDSALESLRRYSRMADVDLIRAVESEALVQLLEQPSDTDFSDTMLLTFEINDFQAALERLSSDEALSETKIDPRSNDDGTPAARNSFFLLSKPKITLEDLQRDGIEEVDELLPKILGVCDLYGKQTDRPARLEVEFNFTPDSETAIARLRDRLQELVVNETSEKVGQTYALELLLDQNSYSPPGLDFEAYQKFNFRQLVNNLKRRFPEFRASAINSLSVAEASTNAELTIPLLALMTRISLTPVSSWLDFSEELRQVADDLGVPRLPERELEGVDIWDLSPLERECLKVESLTDQELAIFYQLSSENSQLRCLRRAIAELLRRPDQTLVPKYSLYENLGHLSFDSAQGLEYLAKARSEARECNLPLGPFLVREFEYRLKFQLFDKLPDLMQTLESKYLDDPQTRTHFANLLKRYGLINSSNGAEGYSTDPSAVPIRQSMTLPTSNDDLLIGSPPDSVEGQPSKLWLPE